MKRHKKEDLMSFAKRRKICNNKRRNREKDGKLIINMQCEEWRSKNKHLL